MGPEVEFPSQAVWAQLGFQTSAYSDGREVRFTVNLSVIRRGVWEEQRSAKPAPAGKTADVDTEGKWQRPCPCHARSPSGSTVMGRC